MDQSNDEAKELVEAYNKKYGDTIRSTFTDAMNEMLHEHDGDSLWMLGKQLWEMVENYNEILAKIQIVMPFDYGSHLH